MKSVALTLASLAAMVAADTCVSSSATWTDTTNVAAAPGSLQKNAGGQLWNAGAISTQAIHASASPQSVSFKCASGGNLMFGLANAFSEHPNGIAFALECSEPHVGDLFRSLTIFHNGIAQVEETTCSSACNRAGPEGKVQYGLDDVLKIKVTGTVVEFFKNDHVFHTAAAAATFPLYADASMENIGTKISDVVMCIHPSVPTPPPPSPAPTVVPPPCTETPPSAAAVGSKLMMEAAGGAKVVSIDLLDDGRHHSMPPLPELPITPAPSPIPNPLPPAPCALRPAPCAPRPAPSVPPPLRR
jgi:hypothetical protein